MLGYPETKIVGAQDKLGGAVICWPCAVKKMGEERAARVGVGLAQDDEWAVLILFAAQEYALQEGAGCTEPGHKMIDGMCPECTELFCFDCGARLDIAKEDG